MRQNGDDALRARRALGLARAGDDQTAGKLVDRLVSTQRSDGSFDGSPMRTAGVLLLFADLSVDRAGPSVVQGGRFLLRVLEAQDGYVRAADRPAGWTIRTPRSLCGFFGPYSARNQPEVLAAGAREINAFRELDPLFGPARPARTAARSSYDRPGPGSCYAWGLMPLSIIAESLCRSGYALDRRLVPALNVLLAVQRDSGGWCRSLTGHPKCTLFALRALAAHPELRGSNQAAAALKSLVGRKHPSPYQILHVASLFDLIEARELARERLVVAVARQKPDGTFGRPARVERVRAVLAAQRLLQRCGTD
jgi:hypothetical protein